MSHSAVVLTVGIRVELLIRGGEWKRSMRVIHKQNSFNCQIRERCICNDS